MRETDDIERLFQESFEGFEATPPASVKANIDRELAAKNRKMWWLLALLFLLTTTVVVSLLISDTETKRNNQSTELAGASNPSTTSSESGHHEQNGKFEGLEAKKTKTDSTQYNEDASVNQTRIAIDKRDITSQPKDQTTKGLRAESSPPLKNQLPATRKQKTKKPVKQQTTGKQGVKTNPTITSSGDGSSTPQDGSTPPTTLAGGSTGTEGTNQATDPTGEKSTKSDSLTTAGTAPKDSLTAKIPDSTGDESKAGPSKPDSPAAWMASLYFGPQFDVQRSKYDYKSLKAAPSFRASVEINRNLVAGYGLNTGVGYNAQNETYTVNTYSIDTASTWLDSIPIFDQQDSIIGYNYFTNYDLDTTETNHTLSSKVSTLFIPIYVSKHFEFNQNWGLLVNAGAVFRISSITSPTDSFPEPLPVQYKTSVMLSARVQGTYTRGSWMFSAGLNCGYYVKPPLGYYEFDRPRYFFSPQVGIHYRF